MKNSLQQHEAIIRRLIRDDYFKVLSIDEFKTLIELLDGVRDRHLKLKQTMMQLYLYCKHFNDELPDDHKCACSSWMAIRAREILKRDDAYEKEELHK